MALTIQVQVRNVTNVRVLPPVEGSDLYFVEAHYQLTTADGVALRNGEVQIQLGGADVKRLTVPALFERMQKEASQKEQAGLTPAASTAAAKTAGKAKAHKQTADRRSARGRVVQ